MSINDKIYKTKQKLDNVRKVATEEASIMEPVFNAYTLEMYKKDSCYNLTLMSLTTTPSVDLMINVVDKDAQMQQERINSVYVALNALRRNLRFFIAAHKLNQTIAVKSQKSENPEPVEVTLDYLYENFKFNLPSNFKTYNLVKSNRQTISRQDLNSMAINVIDVSLNIVENVMKSVKQPAPELIKFKQETLDAATNIKTLLQTENLDLRPFSRALSSTIVSGL